MLKNQQNNTALSHYFTETLAPDGKPFQIFTLKNNNGMTVQIMDWGATWISCQVPVNNENREVLLGCQPEDYLKQGAYLGASIGRYANRIANAQYELNGKIIKLTANQGNHQLHGGDAFNNRRWQLETQGINEKCGVNFVSFSLFSADGEQGFASNVKVSVCFELQENNSLKITYFGLSDADTPLNLTNHAYFNLNNGELTNDVRQHYLQVNSDYFLPVDNEGIPNQPLKAVANTSFDFRQSKQISQDFLQEEQLLTKGYDHSFLLNKADDIAVKLQSENQDLTLEVITSQAALQVYTGNYLSGNPQRNGQVYQDYSGIALETQGLPDTPNHPEWWQYGGMQKANEPYEHWTIFKFY